VVEEGSASREDPPTDRHLPVDIGGGRVDLADDDIEHAIEQLVFVRHVLVQGHRHDAELLGEPAHAEGLDTASIGHD
jgi:hypothetical protein